MDQGTLAAIDMALLRSFQAGSWCQYMRESETRLSMNRGLMEATDRFVHGGQADGPLPSPPPSSKALWRAGQHPPLGRGRSEAALG
jgi:hypothetical protein